MRSLAVRSLLHRLATTLSLAALAFASAQTAQAVGISAQVTNITPNTNLMGLPSVGPFAPGTPDFGSLGLAAPGSGTNTSTQSFAYPSNAPNSSNPVQMFGDGISSITNAGSGSFQVELTVTNFQMNQGTPVATDEYVYLNVWETFTGLTTASNVIWSTSGTISVFGIWSGGAGQFVGIEPAAMAFDQANSIWNQESPFFGANGTGPGGGPLIGSQIVNPLTSYVQGTNLTVGMQAILLMTDLAGTGPATLTLPTSLHLSLTMTPVEVPEPSAVVLAGTAILLLSGQAIRQRRKRTS